MKLGRLFLGLLSGLTFGMLFAPKKGKELRKAILKKSSSSPAEGLKVLTDAVVEAGTEAYEEFTKLSDQPEIKKFTKKSKAKMNEFLDKAREKGKEAVTEIQEKITNSF